MKTRRSRYHGHRFPAEISFPSWATLVEIDQLPILAISILRGLADRYSSLTNSRATDHLQTETTPSNPS
jgi:hypothetical protein